MKKNIEYKITKDNCFVIINRRPNKKGYFQINRNYKIMKIHRYIWEECFGNIPQKMCVCHKCDNPGCINPEHLFLGTIQENNIDKIKKGRQIRGEKIGAAKLKKTNVIQIRKEYVLGLSQKELSKKYNVHKSTIHGIVTMKTWKHLHGYGCKDVDNKNRYKRGEEKIEAKLTSKQVLEMREKYGKSRNVTLREVAKEYGLKNINTIRAILDRKSWKHI